MDSQSKTQKGILIGIVLLAIGAGAAWLYFSKKEKQSSKQDDVSKDDKVKPVVHAKPLVIKKGYSDFKLS